MKNLKFKVCNYPLSDTDLKFLISIQLYDSATDSYLDKWFLERGNEKIACNLTNFLLLYRYNWDYPIVEEIYAIREFLSENSDTK